MNNSKIINLEEKQEPNVFGERVPSRRNRDSGGGGGHMSEYVTKEEFNSAIKDLTHKIEINQEKTNYSLDLLSQKLDSIATSIPDKIQISLDAKEKEGRKETIETRRYIIGTIILSVVGIMVSLLA